MKGRTETIMRPDCKILKIDLATTPEARIISEDDTHAVVAVRLEKAWLTRNMHFLAALADVATPAPIA